MYLLLRSRCCFRVSILPLWLLKLCPRRQLPSSCWQHSLGQLTRSQVSRLHAHASISSLGCTRGILSSASSL
ncbi:hypothetical protein IW261DRAFT_869283 [Armillaria novae-zelandiae]|uniref:Uncharacterized protein n=1 Tax=Armillaria novae-zelandiae TaxID=153914 RepID=A0AA39PIP1_9AGAR|nr:hypothetical protein IW261DRAFT_869283 [Armillaria novae-zelandiae]